MLNKKNIKHIEWWSLKAPTLDFEGPTVGSFLHKKRILLFAKSALRYSLQNRNANKNGYFQCGPLLSAQQVKEFFKLIGQFCEHYCLLGMGYVDQSLTATRNAQANFHFNLPSHYQIYIAVYLFIKRDD